MHRTFRSFDRYVDDVEASLASIRTLLDDLRLAPRPGEGAAALETLVEQTVARIGQEDIDLKPRDMIDEEWEAREVKSVRAALWTMRQTFDARPTDKADWIYELRLVIDDFDTAYERFKRDIER